MSMMMMLPVGILILIMGGAGYTVYLATSDQKARRKKGRLSPGAYARARTATA